MENTISIKKTSNIFCYSYFVIYKLQTRIKVYLKKTVARYETRVKFLSYNHNEPIKNYLKLFQVIILYFYFK